MWFSRRKNPGPINFHFYFLFFHAKVVSAPFIQQLPISILASFSSSGLPYLFIYFYSFASRLPLSPTFTYIYIYITPYKCRCVWVSDYSRDYIFNLLISIWAIAFVDSLLWCCYLPQFVLSLFFHRTQRHLPVAYSALYHFLSTS